MVDFIIRKETHSSWPHHPPTFLLHQVPSLFWLNCPSCPPFLTLSFPNRLTDSQRKRRHTHSQYPCQFPLIWSHHLLWFKVLFPRGAAASFISGYKPQKQHTPDLIFLFFSNFPIHLRLIFKQIGCVTRWIFIWSFGVNANLFLLTEAILEFGPFSKQSCCCFTSRVCIRRAESLPLANIEFTFSKGWECSCESTMYLFSLWLLFWHSLWLTSLCFHVRLQQGWPSDQQVRWPF